jgi:hypothetical protein
MIAHALPVGDGIGTDVLLCPLLRLDPVEPILCGVIFVPELFGLLVFVGGVMFPDEGVG